VSRYDGNDDGPVSRAAVSALTCAVAAPAVRRRFYRPPTLTYLPGGTDLKSRLSSWQPAQVGFSA